MTKNLRILGFDEWFSERADAEKAASHDIARIVAVNKDSFLIRNDDRDVFAEASGKLMFGAESPLDLPAVGDWVFAQFLDDDAFALVHEIIPRKSLLKRKTSGKKIEFQLIAANIDTAFIVQSLGPDFNIRRMERYLVMINEGGIRPVVLLSKSDLSTPHETEERMAHIHGLMPNIQVIAFSGKSGSGMNQIKDLLLPGKTFCLLGSSGVGKTTLLNHLMDEDRFETRSIREKDGKGRHATTRRQLTSLENGAMIIDTPGMRELGNIATATGLSETFDEIAALAEHCFHKNCGHDKEKGCAILSALEDGSISEARYRNYMKMNRESAFNEMSYLEKRRKDKEFAKMCKSVMRNKKKKR